jgi:hypothetical protein
MTLQLQTRAAVMTRRLNESDPELFPIAKRLFPWEMLTFDEADIDWEDRSYHKTLVCRNHPRTRFSTKNPFDRSVFMSKGVNGGDGQFDEGCDCSFKDMRVVKA